MEELLNHVHCMDCIEFLKKLPDNSVDSSVTDSPYGLNFMNKKWDSGAVTFDSDVWSEILRVLKPGAHLLAFGGTRTYHRLACAIEDAGFEIRDQIHWLYGSGFSKGLNISKAIDKKAGAKRERIGTKYDVLGHGKKAHGQLYHSDRKRPYLDNPDADTHWVSLPASEEAKKWDGWNTQIKPAHEPIVLARKPISESSIVDNVLKHGTGGLNIDACRIMVNPDVNNNIDETYPKRNVRRTVYGDYTPQERDVTGVLPSGRYPANLILSHHPDCDILKKGTQRVWSRKRDRYLKSGEYPVGKHGIYGKGLRPDVEVEYDDSDGDVWECVKGCPVRILNEQSGNVGGKWGRQGNKSTKFIFSEYEKGIEFAKRTELYIGDNKGGAARFFYCAKPSVNERNAGLEGRNIHITVKPLELMRWLVRLVTPRGGVVLDPFLGSGTTAIAAENEGCDWLGCDISEEYCEIARLRIVALGGTQTVLDDFDMSLNHEEEVEVAE